jgi:uncharacterized Zn finger protein (UPF0148 family)
MTELRCSSCGSPFKGERRTKGNGPTYCPTCRGDIVVPTSERYNPLNLPLGPSHSEIEARREVRQYLLNQVLDKAEEQEAMEVSRRLIEAEATLAGLLRGQRRAMRSSSGRRYETRSDPEYQEHVRRLADGEVYLHIRDGKHVGRYEWR